MNDNLLIRRIPVYLILAFLCASAAAQKSAPTCSSCAEWNRPQKPFRIFGNTYYVGPHGLSSILITSPAGDILIDGDLPESAKPIAENIRSLSFRVQDIKIILNSHVHFDHAGGIAELQRMTGARVMASPWSAEVLRRGGIGRGDPQNGIIQPVAPAKNVHELRDGETLSLGRISITAHFTPGHTPGGTSWTWQSCEGRICRDIVFADSLAPMSAKGFKFSDGRDYPHALEDFEKSFRFLETTPCDILITTHPEASNLWDRLAARGNGATPDPMVNPLACKDLAKSARERFRQRLAEERGGSSGK